ncbi:MAG TPA: HD domain-containing protein [Rhodocyclaceae bacterium]
MALHPNQHPGQPLPLLLDPTGTVNLANPAEIETAIAAIMTANFGTDWNAEFVSGAIRDVIRAYRGNYPGLLQADTLYHDLRHVLETGLTTARLIDGYAKYAAANGAFRLEPKDAELAVVLALFHDVGLLRKDSEAALTGPNLMPVHEERAVAFLRKYLVGRVSESDVGMAEIVMATSFAFSIPMNWSPAEQLLGCMVASADLLSQLSDRDYLEKCRDFLFVEFSACGLAGTPDSEYPDRETLLAKTPGFISSIVRRRLDHEFRGTYRLLELHTGHGNPWQNAIQRNLAFLEQILASQDFSRLRRSPHVFL